MDKVNANRGDTLVYEIKVKNIGRGSARKVVLWDILPEGFSFVDSDFAKVDLGTMVYEEEEVVTFEVLVDEDVVSGTYTNTAKVTSINHPTIFDEVDVKVSGEVKGEEAFPELKIIKTAKTQSAKPGETIDYFITVINTGDADAIDVVVKDVLPEGFVDEEGNSIIVFELDLLEKGNSWTKVFPIKIEEDTVEGDYENVANVKAENFPDEVEDKAVVRVKVLPKTGNTLNTLLLISFGALLIGLFGLIKFAGKKFRKAILVTVFSALVLASLALLIYPFIPAIKYSLSAQETEPQEIDKIVEEIEGDWLFIPKIGVEIPIVLGQDESALEEGAWLLPEGSFPDLGGNTILAAHRFKYRPPHKETFYLLDKVEIDDTFFIYFEGVKYNYKVKEVKIVDPEAVEILAPSQEAIVTLITCYPLFSDKQRLIVVGELI